MLRVFVSVVMFLVSSIALVGCAVDEPCFDYPEHVRLTIGPQAEGVVSDADSAAGSEFDANGGMLQCSDLQFGVEFVCRPIKTENPNSGETTATVVLTEDDEVVGVLIAGFYRIILSCWDLEFYPGWRMKIVVGEAQGLPGDTFMCTRIN